MRNRGQDVIIRGIEVVLIGLTFLAFAKAIWISLDIDESYAVACAYRMVRGDRLIRDMWEPHQLSAFLAAIFAAPYIRIRGNTDYLVIYLRIIGVLVHTGMGVLLYRQLAKYFHRFFVFCIMILHLNFLPKWVQMPEFELMHYWCLLGIFLMLHAYFTTAEKFRMILPFFGGGLLVVSMLCYPTMILLYPIYIIAICMLERQCCTPGAAKWWKSCAAFTLGSFLTGMLFLTCLLSYMSLDELKRYISYIFLDTSHGVYTMGEKWAIYLKQIQEQAGFYGWYLLTAAGITLVLCLIYRLAPSRNTSCESSPKRRVSGKDIWPMVITILTLAGLLMQIKAIAGFLLEDENQFFFQVRYMAVMLPALLICIRCYKKMAIWMYLCIIPGCMSVMAVLFVTNMDTNTTYAKAFLGVLGSVLIIYRYGRDIMASSWKKVFLVLSYTLGGMLLAGFWVCRLILIRVSGCQPVTIRAPMERMENGPEKGIYVLADTANIWNDNYRELENVIDREDRVLYIGAESLIYVEMEALPATPSTQGTTVYNEMFLRYYEEHPERVPDVIVYDKTFGENPAYSLYYDYSLQNPEFFQWIEENYRGAQKIETGHMIILRQ